MLRTRNSTLVYVVIQRIDPKIVCLHKSLQRSLYVRLKLDLCTGKVMYTLRYVSTNVCERMRNLCMLNYLEIPLNTLRTGYSSKDPVLA